MDFPRKVYAIQHNITKRIYIGSSKDVTVRYWTHIYSLRNGTHTVEDMIEDFARYGENFSLFILDEIKDMGERHKEYDWMEKYQSHIRGLGYNYKDISFRPARGRKIPPIKEGVPCENCTKKAIQIKAIEELLHKCDDDTLLVDLILKLLQESI